MKNFFLYFATVFIWGSTWLAIKFQIGEVDPMASVVYRFSLAALILLVYCKIRGFPLTFGLKDHFYIFLFGALLFSVNYWLVYVAEIYLTSGLVAVVFSSLVFMNVLNGRLFLKTPVNPGMILGSVIGITGIGLIYWPEISSFEISDSGTYGLLLSLVSVYLASLGNITSARNQKHGLPVLQTNAYAMAYGAIIMFLVTIVSGKSFDFSLSITYVSSLFYLSIFGSIAGFGFYLTLLGRIGADRAAYAIMLVPVVALGLSTLFEGYVWTVDAFWGLFLVLAGNFVILWEKTSLEQKKIVTGHLDFKKAEN